MSNPRWWRPEQHALRRGRLITRNRLAAALRGWFAGEGFTEVETAALQVSPGNETHLHALAAPRREPDGTLRSRYLHTSPEFACKKLLSAGEERIFTLARVWRDREKGALHSPEFTMLEWYRTGAPLEALMDDCARFLRLAAEIGGRSRFEFRGRAIDPFAEPERLSLREAFARYAGVDLAAILEDRDAFAAVAGVRLAPDDSWSDIFTRVLVEKIEPRLGEDRATILHSYPLSEAALARPNPEDPRFADRFEIYACGIELANCFAELTDPVEQRRRFEADMAERQTLYGEAYPIDEDFLDALAIMPPASGGALGFDRLALLASGATHIDQVLWTPVD